MIFITKYYLYFLIFSSFFFLYKLNSFIAETEQLVNEDLINRYGQAIEDLNKLKKQNEELRGVLRRQETVKKPVLVPNVSDLYTYEHEVRTSFIN